MKTIANTPFDLFFVQLCDLYNLEVQLYESMHHLISLCTNEELQYLIVTHAHQNCDQIAALDAVFMGHGESPKNGKCKAIAELIKGGTARLEAMQSPHTRDLMMIAHCLRIEYHEIAAYEFTTLLSGRLGLKREPRILRGLLAEEKTMAASLKLLQPDLVKTTSPGDLLTHSPSFASSRDASARQTEPRPKKLSMNSRQPSMATSKPGQPTR